jgi:16S rRNA processing protein RimM
MRVNPPKKTTPNSAGTIVGLFGLRGECKVDASRLGSDSLAAGIAVRATLRDGTQRELRVRAHRLHNGRPLVAFEGFDDATAAEPLIGASLLLDAADLVLAEGEYLDRDLIGCTLVDEAGRELGIVVDVAHHTAQDLLVVGERRAYVPLVRAFVQRVDVRAKRISVTLPPGLLDDERAERA